MNVYLLICLLFSVWLNFGSVASSVGMILDEPGDTNRREMAEMLVFCILLGPFGALLVIAHGFWAYRDRHHE